ncbi:C-Jun-amino-terminal kinase-interacting protein 1 [Mactra antiquata]
MEYKMMQLQRPIGTELTLRLVHDLSPDSDDSMEEEDDESLEVQRERFLISCLAQSAINNNNNNSISDVQNTTCGRFCDTTETITETYAKLEWQQTHLEQINNHINEQHLNKVHETTTTSQYPNINLINNNFLQSQDVDSESSDKENVQPATLPTKHTGGKSRRPRKLPDIPKPGQGPSSALKPKPVHNEKCLADELQEALVKDEHDIESDNDDVFLPQSTKKIQKVYPKYSCKFLEELKHVKFNSVSKNTRALLNSDNMYLKEDSTERSEHHQTLHEKSHDLPRDKPREMLTSSSGQRNGDDGGESRRHSNSFPATNYQDLEVTHRGMHRFVPRHKDEMSIEIGDPIHVVKTDDDLWCEGINLRSSQRGIFPCMYATDLGFLEEEEEENGCSKFFLRFLGSVEVNYHKGDEILCQAINKVALSRRSVKTSLPPPLCTLEISQYGIRMYDKSKSGHEQLDTFAHFFALKNITFCGHHPRNERYFAFITKHPNQYRYACHVFLGEKSTHTVTDAVGQAFKRFYQEYMAFTHPTEDIYME